MSQSRKAVRDKRKQIGRWLMMGLGIYLIVVLAKGLWEVSRAGGRVKEVQDEVTKLQQEQEKLQRQLVTVGSEAFVEQQIRDQLLLARPEETVVVIPQIETDGNKRFPPSPEATEDTVANWQKWAMLFL